MVGNVVCIVAVDSVLSCPDRTDSRAKAVGRSREHPQHTIGAGVSARRPLAARDKK